MAGWYLVQEGDCLSSLARKAGLASWKKIFYHPKNGDFRALRPDPNVIQPDDKVYIPDPDPSEVPAGTDKEHRFVKKKISPPCAWSSRTWMESPIRSAATGSSWVTPYTPEKPIVRD